MTKGALEIISSIKNHEQHLGRQYISDEWRLYYVVWKNANIADRGNRELIEIFPSTPKRISNMWVEHMAYIELLDVIPLLIDEFALQDPFTVINKSDNKVVFKLTNKDGIAIVTKALLLS